MKRLQDLYQNNKFFGAMLEANIKPSGEWIDSINIDALDKYFYINARKKRVFSDIWAEQTMEEAYRNICAILTTYEYKLDGLYESMFFDYDPLVNYDRHETQTHNEKIEADERITKNNIGARSQTDNANAKTTAFDSSDYGKATDNNSASSSLAAAEDKTTAEAYEDKSSGGYTLNVKGNIGVTTSQQMLESQRQVVEFNFYAKLLDVFYECILNSNWEV